MKVIDIIKSLFASLKSLSTRKKKPKPSLDLPEQKPERNIPYKLVQDTPKSIQDLPEQESPFILVSDANQTEFHRINIDEPKQATFTRPIACEIDGHSFDIMPQNYKSLLLTIVNYIISIKHPRIRELEEVSFIRDYPFFMDETVREKYCIRASNGKYIFTENRPQTIVFLIRKLLDYCEISKESVKIFASFSKQHDSSSIQANNIQTVPSSCDNEQTSNTQQFESIGLMDTIHRTESPQAAASGNSHETINLGKPQGEDEEKLPLEAPKGEAPESDLSDIYLRKEQFIVDFKNLSEQSADASDFRVFLSDYPLPEGVTENQIFEVMESLPQKLNLPIAVNRNIFSERVLSNAQELVSAYFNAANYHELNVQTGNGLFAVGARAWIDFLKANDTYEDLIDTQVHEEVKNLAPEDVSETIEDNQPDEELPNLDNSEDSEYDDNESAQGLEPVVDIISEPSHDLPADPSEETRQFITSKDDRRIESSIESSIASPKTLEEPRARESVTEETNGSREISNETNIPANTPQRTKPSEEKRKAFIDYLTKNENMSYPNAVYTAIALENIPEKFRLPAPEYDFYECKSLTTAKQIRNAYVLSENFRQINQRENQIYSKAMNHFHNFIYTTTDSAPIKTFSDTEIQLIHEIEKFIVRNNVIYIPSTDPAYHRLATYARQHRHRKTVDRLIQFFGFRRTYERPIQPGDPEESDMQEHDYSGNDLVDRAFAQYPLIGSMTLTDEERSAILDEARELINKKLSERNKNFTARDKSILTLAIIQIAKDWDSSKQSKFWNYISRYLGYRDAESQSGWATVESLLKNALEDTCRDKKRIFIEDTGQRWFRGTVTLHALTPRDSWYAFFDFLFDFYRENLNWKATPNDPLIETMIQSLRQRFSDVKEEDYKITISSKSYSFREGIRKLIVARPKFSSKLSYELIAYIHALLNNSNSEPERYEEKLCCEWFEDKIGRIAEIRKDARSFPDESGEVATDYSRIQAKFILKDDNKILLSLPEIRLEGEKSKPDLKLELYQGEELLQIHENLPYYGNELGWTLKSKKLELTSIKGANDFGHLKVRLLSSDEIIYDSEEKLFRKAFIFKGQNEITDHHKLSVGEYTMITPQSRDIEINIENGEISPITGFQLQGWTANFIELNSNFFLSVGKTLSISDREGSGVDFHVIPPDESTRSPIFTLGEENFVFAKRTSSIGLFLSDCSQINHYVVRINDERIDLKNFNYDSNSPIIKLPFKNLSKTCRFRVLDMNEEKLLYRENYFLVNRASFIFDKEFYFSSSDYQDASLSIYLDDYSEKLAFSENDETLLIPYNEGEIQIQIPRIYLEVVEEIWNYRERPAWYFTQIPRESQFKISCSKEINASISLGDSVIPFERGFYPIGEMIHSNPDSHILSAPITLVLGKNNQVLSKYPLTSVFYKEQFLNHPKFREENGILYWEQGRLFIGKENPKFTLRLRNKTDKPLEFPFSTETVSIHLPEGIPEGLYSFEIDLVRQNLFKTEKEKIEEGSVLIGDKNRLRFKDRRIVINEITSDPKDQGIIIIHPCYVDQIEYFGEQETSEGCCPVYRGVMYRYEKEKRIDFTSEEQANRYVVNPVRMIYISDRSMSITDKHGDGLYYRKMYDYDTDTYYRITDIEYNDKTKRHYSTVELYIYITERI